jgi:amidase
VVFPVSQVMEGHVKDENAVEYEPRNEKDAYNWGLWKNFGEEGYKDAPVSLQLCREAIGR